MEFACEPMHSVVVVVATVVVDVVVVVIVTKSTFYVNICVQNCLVMTSQMSPLQMLC